MTLFSRCLSAPLALIVVLIATAGCGDSQQIDQQHLQKAFEFYEKNQYQAGLIELKNALQANPENAEAYWLLGVIYLDIGYLEAAEQALQQARTKDINHDRWKTPLARIYSLRGEYQKFIDEPWLASGLQDSDDSSLLALRANAMLALNKIDDARALIARSVELDPDDVDGLAASSQLALWDGELNDALRLAEKSLARNPERYDALAIKGTVLRARGALEDALADFEKSLATQPNNVFALLGKANTLFDMEDYEAAMEITDKLLAGQDEIPQAYFLQGRLLLARGNPKAALFSFQQANRIDPSHMPSQLMLGILNYRFGELKLAAGYLTRYVEAFPDELRVRKLLAAAQIGSDDPFAAVLTLEPALGDASQDVELLSMLGSAYIGYGRHDKGLALLQQAAAIAPEAPTVHTQLALSQLQQGELAAAVQQLQQAIKLDPGSSQADVLLILTWLQRREYLRAQTAVDALVARQPDNPIAYNLLGMVQMARTEQAAARQAFGRALELDPGFIAARLNLGRLALQTQDYAAAEASFRKILDQDAQHLDALLALADTAQQAGQPDQQLDWLRKARKYYPKSTEAGLKLGHAYLSRGEPRLALQIAHEVQLDSGPEEPRMLNLMGRALVDSGEPLEAASYFRKLTRIEADSVSAWHMLAYTLLAAEDFDAARRALAQAANLQEDYLPIWITRSRLAIATEDYPAALATAQKVQSMQPKLTIGFQLAGDVYRSMQDWEKATEAYDQALRRAPSTDSLLRLARTTLHSHGSVKAISVLNQWLQLHPQDIAVRGELAVLLQRQSRVQDAIAEYEQVLAREPNNLVALNNLAWHYNTVKDRRCIEYAERAVELAPERADVLDTLGWLLVQNGEAQRGVSKLQEALLRLPHPDIRYHLAFAYAELGRPEDAKRELDKILANKENFDSRDNALQLRAQLP